MVWELGGVIIAAIICVWSIYMVIGEFSAVAYVPSAAIPVLEILKKLGLSKDKIFWDLGSGDGRIVGAVEKKFNCLSVGFEINPLLVVWSRVRTNARIEWKSLWKADLSQPDFIYCYLSPRAMRKIADKFLREGKKGAVLISKAFAAKNLQDYLIETVTIDQRKIFVYRKL